jgi:hypothetical protein
MQFSAGRVLGRSTSVLLAQLPAFLVIAAVLFTPVFVVSLIVGPGSVAHGHAADSADLAAARSSEIAGQFSVGILAFIAQYLLAGAVAYAALRHLDGRKTGFADAVVGGLRRLLPVVDSGFVAGILVGIGFLLLVVPGVILGCMLYVAVPAAQAERLDVTHSLGRSMALTRGRRTSVLLVMLASLLPMVLVGVLLPILLADAGRTVALLVGAHAQLLFGLFGGVCMAVGYHDLCAEAPSGDDLPDVRRP